MTYNNSKYNLFVVYNTLNITEFFVFGHGIALLPSHSVLLPLKFRNALFHVRQKCKQYGAFELCSNLNFTALLRVLHGQLQTSRQFSEQLIFQNASLET
jgi:hypothetical protein